MKKLFLVFWFVILLTRVDGQPVAQKMWDYRFGGDTSDRGRVLIETMDHGFVLAGTSVSSISFDKSDYLRGVSDYWIVKTDSVGNFLWDKTYGGNDWDELRDIVELPDSGFLLGGISVSDSGFDKSDSCHGLTDYWIVRIDKSGNKLWDRTYGGNGSEFLYNIKLLTDGSFILAGETRSDSTGQMSHHSYGGVSDYWIIKIDSNGNRLWDKNYGGTGVEWISSVALADNGQLILAGTSDSPSNGIKSQNSFSGSKDYWILKIDSTGNKIWDKTYGGNGIEWTSYNSILRLSNNKFLLSGLSLSPISGNKTLGNHGSPGYWVDYWLVCIDSSGNKLWEQVVGGDDDEDAIFSVSTFDNGILITGESLSDSSGDKSENNIYSGSQPWVTAIDTNGNVLWDITLHNPNWPWTIFGLQVEDGCFVFLSATEIAGGYASQSRNSQEDFWLSKFCLTNVPPVSNFNSIYNSICQGSCISFNNMSMYANNYEWYFPGANPLMDTTLNPQNICYTDTGFHDVILISKNSFGTDTLTQHNLIYVYPQVQFNPLYQVGDILFSTPGFATYQWYLDSIPIANANSYFYIASINGTYGISITDSIGCTAFATLLNVNVSVPEYNEVSANNSFYVYPQPTTNYIFLTLSDLKELSFFDLAGNKIMDLNAPGKFVNVSDLPNGYYLVRGVTCENKIYFSKFLKQ
jgi:hypothetical protein